MTSGLFLKALSRAEALPEATLRGGLGCPSPVQRRAHTAIARSLPLVAWATGSPAAFGQPRIALATRGHFRLPGAEPVPCVFGGWLTCSARPGTSSGFPRSPWASENACVPPKTVLQANAKIKPASISAEPPAAGLPRRRAWAPGARGRVAASALSALALCPLTVLWDNIPFRSRRPICQWAALFVVIYSVTASRGPASHCLRRRHGRDRAWAWKWGAPAPVEVGAGFAVGWALAGRCPAPRLGASQAAAAAAAAVQTIRFQIRSARKRFFSVVFILTRGGGGGGNKQVGWVPCPLSPAPGPPTKSPVCLDAKTLGAGGAAVHLQLTVRGGSPFRPQGRGSASPGNF